MPDMDEENAPKAILTSMEVKDIIASSYGENGKRCYKVQWKESWVFEEHLVNCKQLLAKFWKENSKGAKQQTNGNFATPIPGNGLPQRGPTMSSRKRDAKGKAKVNIEAMANHLKQGSSSKGPSSATEMDGVWVLDSNHGSDNESDFEAGSDFEDETIKSSKKKNFTPYELKCDVCEAEFRKITEFRKHYASQHPGVNPFDCEVCHQRFGKKENLMRHMMKHTGEYPYFCNFCGKTAADPSTLRKHVEAKHKIEAKNANTGIKKSTPNKNNGSQASMICHICSKEIETIKAFKEHFRAEHPDMKPFQCDICGKGFEKKENLTRHIRVHTNDRIYSCDLCGKSYTDGSSLKKHVKMQICILNRRSGKKVTKAVAEVIKTRGDVASASQVDLSFGKSEDEVQVTDSQAISEGNSQSNDMEPEAQFIIEASTSQQPGEEQNEESQQKERVSSIESLLQTIKQVNELGTVVQSNGGTGSEQVAEMSSRIVFPTINIPKGFEKGDGGS
ncbi:zinc finger and BTB domain-containing protein 49-like [Clytia hemisphaerica]|uniref:C2H2-type domain-containing protein n=1 Tax=Clytia hemisphaerica TaxID=252671 RepID=A0A7M5V1T3_9CNID